MTDATASPAAGVTPRAKSSLRKLAWLAGLAIATLIPTTLITGLISEREERQTQVQAEIAHSWGPPQSLAGPAILMPLDTQTPSWARIAAKTLDTTVEFAPSRRHRGFFGATVYSATIHMRGTVSVPDALPSGTTASVRLPDKAFLAMTISDTKGLTGADRASVAGVEASWRRLEETGPPACRGRDKVIAIPVDLSKGRTDLPFDAVLHLHGTDAFQLSITAKTMSAAIKSAWPTPRFTGDESPDTTALSREGFDARWHVGTIDDPQLATSSCLSQRAAATPTIGVDLIEAVPIYRMVTRAAKYGPVFVVFAFTAYFVFELLTGLVISVLQYGLMAASLSLFALLLVSFSEFTGYGLGYLVSAALVVAQASIFTASVLRRTRPAIGFAALLAGLFGCLYVLLGLENLALLVGSVALFVTLSIVMAVTQKVQQRHAASM